MYFNYLLHLFIAFIYCIYLLHFIVLSGGCIWVRDVIFAKIGEEWIFLTMLGVIMALLSFIMDYIIEKCQEGTCDHYV